MIKLNIVDSNSFFIVAFPCLSILAAYYAFHADLVLAMIFAFLTLNLRRFASILGFSKLSSDDHETGGQLTLIIFDDGAVRLESLTKGRIEGYLGSNHWCTRHMALIRLVTGGKVQHLLALSFQQEKPENFRCLNMWLRQKFYPGAGSDMPASGSTHDKGVVSLVKRQC